MTHPVHLSFRLYGLLAALLLGGAAGSWSAEPSASPRFLGELSCSSSGCHGGAKDGLDQFTAWKQSDVHTRAYATLTTPRSQRIGELLKIDQPTTAARCTTCHAPFCELESRAGVSPAPRAHQRERGVGFADGTGETPALPWPASLRDAKVRPEAGVSCESCHGAAEPWLRSHARPDYTHADRVAAGLRDLKNSYHRANTCVACHQHLEPDLRSAGHPPLIFELDGQCVSQPRHWRERAGQNGGQLWFVGQAVALREMSWHLERASTPDPAAIARWQALVWLLQRTANAMTNLLQIAEMKTDPTPANFQRNRELSDALARRAAELEWTPAFNERLLHQLAATTNDFADAALPRLVQACRAERLLLGLDRLFVAARNKPAAAADAQLQALFKAVQSLPDFDPGTFAKQLGAFNSALAPTGARK